MRGIETKLISANGLTFETDCAGDGDRFALLLHGFPESTHSWRFQLPLLAKMGFTVWAPNLRGYRGSSRPRGRTAYRIEYLVRDVLGLIAAAKSQRAFKDISLIGHDWGAMIAWATAAKAPQSLDRLVIMNVPHPALFRRALKTPAQLARSWYVFFFQLPWLPERLLSARDGMLIAKAMREAAADKTNFSERDLAPFRAAARDAGTLTAMINYYRANLFSPLMFRLSSPSATQIAVPTLMLWGEKDTALGKELTYDTERFVRRLTIRYLPGVSHWVQQEAPAIVNALLAAFLLDRPVPTAAELVRAAPELLAPATPA